MTVSTSAIKTILEGPAVLTPTTQPASTLEAVQRRLRESSYYYLRTISCAFDDGVLTLRGRVPSFYLKQTVQVIVEKVEGVRQVINLVDVSYPAKVG